MEATVYILRCADGSYYAGLTKQEVEARGRQIKGWSRAKKEALIALQYEWLPELARNREGGAKRPRGSPIG